MRRRRSCPWLESVCRQGGLPWQQTPEMSTHIGLPLPSGWESPVVSPVGRIAIRSPWQMAVRDACPTGDRLDEGTVKRRVVCEDRRPAHELRQTCDCLPGGWGIRHIRIADVRQPLDLGRNRLRWPHEGLESVHHLAPAQSGRGDLYELAPLEREPRRLGVQDDDILLQEVKAPLPRPVGKGKVPLANRLGHSGQNDGLQRHLVGDTGVGPLCHSGNPLIFQRPLHEALAQLRELYAGVTSGIGNEAPLGHAGDGVDLQDDGRSVLLHDEVAP